MRTPDQVIADLKKAEKNVEDAIAARDRLKQELLDMAKLVNDEIAALTPKPVLVSNRAPRTKTAA